MVNFMRNIGSSVGTSMVTTLIARRSQYHQSVLVGHVTPASLPFLAGVTELTNYLIQAGLSPDQAQVDAQARVYRAAQNQAATLAYIDTFWILAVAAAIMFALSFTLKKNEPGGGPVGAEG
jgi:DHA2 family multidrug resistance protein